MKIVTTSDAMTKKIIHLPIDWKDIHKKTGFRRMKLCKSLCFGWGVYNMAGERDGVNFATYEPPYNIGDEHENGTVSLVRVHEGRWEITIDIP